MPDRLGAVCTIPTDLVVIWVVRLEWQCLAGSGEGCADSVLLCTDSSGAP
jgi:hypothetical protein